MVARGGFSSIADLVRVSNTRYNRVSCHIQLMFAVLCPDSDAPPGYYA